MIHWPVIAIDAGDVTVNSTLSELRMNIEHYDVDEWAVFDISGQNLTLVAEAVESAANMSKWLKWTVVSPPPVIDVRETGMYDLATLQQAIATYIAKLPDGAEKTTLLNLQTRIAG